MNSLVFLDFVTKAKRQALQSSSRRQKLPRKQPLRAQAINLKASLKIYYANIILSCHLVTNFLSSNNEIKV